MAREMRWRCLETETEIPEEFRDGEIKKYVVEYVFTRKWHVLNKK